MARNRGLSNKDLKKLHRKGLIKSVRDWAFGLSALFTVSAAPALAQEGYITDIFDGSPKANLEVSFLGQEDITDVNGYFDFFNDVVEEGPNVELRPKNLSYSLIDILGRTAVSDVPVNGQDVWLGNNLPSGTYFLFAKDANGNPYSVTKAINVEGNWNFSWGLESRLDGSNGGKNVRTSQALQNFSVIGDGIYPRITYVDDNIEDLIELDVVPSTFNMAAYDQICRSRDQGIAPGTQRWMHFPNFYVVTGGNVFDIYGETEIPSQAQIDSVESIILNDLPVFTQGLINPNDVVIQHGESPPVHYEGDYPVPDSSWVTVYWTNDINTPGTHFEFLDDNNSNLITSGFVKFRGNLIVYRGNYLEEMTQPLGPRADTYFSDVRESVFYETLPDSLQGTNDGYYSDFDLNVGRFLYGRAPGNQSPDSDSHNYVGLVQGN